MEGFSSHLSFVWNTGPLPRSGNYDGVNHVWGKPSVLTLCCPNHPQAGRRPVLCHHSLKVTSHWSLVTSDSWLGRVYTGAGRWEACRTSSSNRSRKNSCPLPLTNPKPNPLNAARDDTRLHQTREYAGKGFQPLMLTMWHFKFLLRERFCIVHKISACTWHKCVASWSPWSSPFLSCDTTHRFKLQEHVKNYKRMLEI